MKFIKTNRFIYRGKNIVSFTNRFVKYGIGLNRIYYIMIVGVPFFSKEDLGFAIYKSKKKPIFRNINIIAAPLILLAPIITPIVFILALLKFLATSYFNGLLNFVKDCAWVEGVRFFNWINFIALIISLLYIIFR